MQRQRLQTVHEDGLPPDVGYGLGIFTVGGWIGHNGSIPGYQTVVVYQPDTRTTLAILTNSDISPPGGGEASSALAEAITTVLTPSTSTTWVPSRRRPRITPMEGSVTVHMAAPADKIWG